MINYYEVLEVSEKASDEIIEKAYKVLAKKYHPDLQQGDNKKVAEEKMKLVNEAYEVLSNHEKRENYNKKLNEQKERENIKQQVNNNYTAPNRNKEQNSINNYAKQKENKDYYRSQTYDKEELKRQQKFRENLEKEARRRYLDAYDNYLRSLGYRVRYRWTWERVKALLITILVISISLGILWVIPPSREYMIKLYEENFVIKMIVDIIGSLIDSFFSIFKK